MLLIFSAPQIKDDCTQGNLFSQQDGTPPHYHAEVQDLHIVVNET
jgi:hypothetical protein